MRSIRIYEQAADTADPAELAAFERAVAAVTAEGIEVERLRLGRNQEAFRRCLVVRRLIEVEGEEMLPATTVDELIVLYGRYPSADQLRRYAGAMQAVRSITLPGEDTAGRGLAAPPAPRNTDGPAVRRPGSGSPVEAPMAGRTGDGCGCGGGCGCSHRGRSYSPR
ncbi:arsenic metallochaperone ArsD family protein [Propionibacterium australiense]|uniref:Arsenical-resistance operon trans-acting repressor ArsD n=1 Tax=Propionibacterium australiense TaxID=119981 RepID=A0A383S4N9_9ACTN|nr:arsenic metallochaperone ArsD family protein [Propionibacterium australiense]RLP11616.1 arsenical resistance operon transcriptional repressor ArsD [Propionibacterium australiense]SYZ32339.1 Arsenical-resistance operon trans-acting repressor ArsD [Propionibacterium australiense]VEH90408.1 Arsenical resistance operon trans-acting repressor ArsD [Propionibacterium australiense]